MKFPAPSRCSMHILSLGTGDNISRIDSKCLSSSSRNVEAQASPEQIVSALLQRKDMIINEAKSKCVPLLSLPRELLCEVFDYLITPWSLCFQTTTSAVSLKSRQPRPLQHERYYFSINHDLHYCLSIARVDPVLENAIYKVLASQYTGKVYWKAVGQDCGRLSAQWDFPGPFKQVLAHLTHTIVLVDSERAPADHLKSLFPNASLLIHQVWELRPDLVHASNTGPLPTFPRTWQIFSASNFDEYFTRRASALVATSDFHSKFSAAEHTYIWHFSYADLPKGVSRVV